MSKDDWKELGYTDEESEELERLSMLGSTGNVDAHVADKILRETMRKYELEKENKTMSNKELLGKSFVETLKEGAENFANWTNAMSIILNKRNKLELENNLDALKEFDSALTDLKKVSEETIKAATEK